MLSRPRPACIRKIWGPSLPRRGAGTRVADATPGRRRHPTWVACAMRVKFPIRVICRMWSQKTASSSEQTSSERWRGRRRASPCVQRQRAFGPRTRPSRWLRPASGPSVHTRRMRRTCSGPRSRALRSPWLLARWTPLGCSRLVPATRRSSSRLRWNFRPRASRRSPRLAGRSERHLQSRAPTWPSR